MINWAGVLVVPESQTSCLVYQGEKIDLKGAIPVCSDNKIFIFEEKRKIFEDFENVERLLMIFLSKIDFRLNRGGSIILTKQNAQNE